MISHQARDGKGGRRLVLLLSESVSPSYDHAQQDRDGHRWARRNGFTVVRSVHEAQGGEAWQEGLQLVQDKAVDGVLVASLAHLGPALVRQEALLQYIWAHGARVYTVSDGEIPEDDPDDPMRTAMRQMRGVMEELIRSLDAQRGRGEPCLLCGQPKPDPVRLIAGDGPALPAPRS
ncbi:recombinase family protein [Streptomyces natalensis]|uniref:recombinase family protein n=1 Tax=Streptomyces natalensis TaxID=68242 RepID=UPI00068980D7|nr:recombinase family protein [Streptomyces natalensis]